jgi:bifunctional DNA-binding transcriptional regulator/antitoxin component of YhaV-PrlF toxin-antitoxin module
MSKATISRGGQIQVPARVRRRWGTREVIVEDQGSSLVIRPLPADPIGAAMGSLKAGPASTDELRRQAREEEAEAGR